MMPSGWCGALSVVRTGWVVVTILDNLVDDWEIDVIGAFFVLWYSHYFLWWHLRFVRADGKMMAMEKGCPGGGISTCDNAKLPNNPGTTAPSPGRHWIGGGKVGKVVLAQRNIFGAKKYWRRSDIVFSRVELTSTYSDQLLVSHWTKQTYSILQ